MGMPAFMHLLPMVGMGYASVTAHGLLKGRLPADPFEDTDAFLKTVGSAILQSGFGGIVGDYLFNNYRQYGHRFWDVTLGPTASTIQDLYELSASFYFALWRGDPVAAKTWNTMKKNAPYGNFWATRTAVDYFINYQIQEGLNPGYLRRMERRAKKNNQKFWLSPARFVNR
jgi:hypothetical protein